MQNEKNQNEYINNLNTKLNEWSFEFDEDHKNRRRKIIQTYVDDFKTFDSESLYPWGDLSMFVESF